MLRIGQMYWCTGGRVEVNSWPTVYVGIPGSAASVNSALQPKPQQLSFDITRPDDKAV